MSYESKKITLKNIYNNIYNDKLFNKKMYTTEEIYGDIMDNNVNNKNLDNRYMYMDEETLKIKEQLDNLDKDIKIKKIKIDNNMILDKINILTNKLINIYQKIINNKNINKIKLPKLTKIDSNNNIRIWWIEIDKNIYYIYSSIDNGKIRKESNRGIEKNKNKKNYINEIQDSKNKAFKKWKDKINQGMILYFHNIIYKMKDTYINKDIFPLSPMLAVKYDNENTKSYINNLLNNNKYIYIQPKYDGCRCISTYNEKYKNKYNELILLFSRGKKEWKYLYNIRKELNILYNILKKMMLTPKNNNIIYKYDPFLYNQLIDVNFYDIHFDGELYIHGKSRDYLNSIISKKKNIHKNDNLVKYLIYDFIDIEKLTYHLRFKLLFLLRYISIYFNFKYVIFSYTFSINDISYIDKFHNLFVKLNYEGLIIRNPDGVYYKKINYRSKNLIKYKSFIDDEFPIVGAHCGTGKHSGCIIWQVKNNNGAIFSVTPEDTIDNRRKLYNKWLSDNSLFINKLLTVKFLKYNDNNIPEVATGTGIRLSRDL